MARTKKLTDPIYSPTNPTSEAAIRAQIDDSIQEVYDQSAKATDTVNLTGNQTIADVKTFSSSPIVPTPTTSTQVANKSYVDGVAISATIPLDSLTDDYLASAPGNIKPRVATLETNLDILRLSKTDTGIADAYVVDTEGTFERVDGNTLSFIPSNTNTGASTINEDGNGVVTIEKYDIDTASWVALEAEDLKKFNLATISWNASRSAFQLAPRGGVKLYGNEFTKLGETASTGSTIQAISNDGVHIYVGSDDGYVRKYDIDTMTLQNTSPLGGTTIRGIKVDSTHVYVGNASTNVVTKYNKSDLSLIGTTPSYGGGIVSIDIDETYLYVGGDVAFTVRKYLKSTLAYVGQTPSYGGTIQFVKINATHIFACGNTTQTVRKYDISTLAFVSETPNFGALPTAISLDSSYIYVSGSATTSKKFDISTMALVTTSLAYGGNLGRQDLGGRFLFTGGRGSNPYRTLNKTVKTNLNIVETTADYGGTINAVDVLNNEYVFIGGTITNKVYKYGFGKYILKSGVQYDLYI